MKSRWNHVMCLCAAVVVGVLAGGSNAMAQATGAGSHNKESLQQMYMDYLVEEGFRPEIDGDGDVHFKKEGRS